MSQRTILVWFRNDLRVHDNEILFEAVKKSSVVVPVYCVDPRYFEKSTYGTFKTGVLRTKFLLESVADLKRSLQQLGGDLLVVSGKPEEKLPEIAKKYQVTEVYHHREVASEETEISARVEAALWKQQINLKHFIGHTLYHKEELPFPIKDIPDIFNTFRKKIERDSTVRQGFGVPSSVTVPSGFEQSDVPGITSNRVADFPEPAEYDDFFEGGETVGLRRLREYLENDLAEKQRKAVRGSVEDHSSRLSPWIALGCLSVRKVYWEIKNHEREQGVSAAANALIFELLWRDYFRFMFKKHGSDFFTNGQATITEAPDLVNQLPPLFTNWASGKTGQPAIDASMQQLNATGYLSDSARRDTANYLVKELKINWTLGAAYFEEKLIDYSPASNWGNWAQIAGVVPNLRK